MLVEFDLEELVGLELEPPCEYDEHEELGNTAGAAYWIHSFCSACAYSYKSLICKQCFNFYSNSYVECTCGIIELGSNTVVILEVL